MSHAREGKDTEVKTRREVCPLGIHAAQWPHSDVLSTRDTAAMDASLYFRLTDRIDGAASLEELAAIEAEIERTQPHLVERRALERRLNRRERTLSGAAV